MGFSIFLIIAGICLIAIWIWNPNSKEERKDPEDSTYGLGFFYQVRGILAGILSLSLGLVIVFEQTLGFTDGTWFVVTTLLTGIVATAFGVLIFVSSKFNNLVWRFLPAGSSPKRDRRWLGAALLTLGLTNLIVWGALWWPY